VAVEKFLRVLNENRTLLPELLVEPEGLESEPSTSKGPSADTDDPLLLLFYGESLAVEEFHEAMRKQRTTSPAVTGGRAAAAHA
jgi:hypothetical protein